MPRPQQADGSVEFFIPITFTDLLEDGGDANSYVVSEVLPLTIIPAKVYECRSAFMNKGPTAVLKNFDSLFSVLRRFDYVNTDTREVCWETLIKAISKQSEHLQTSGIDPEEITDQRNTLKMNVYLLCQFIYEFENITKAETLQTAAKPGRGSSKKTTKSVSAKTDVWDWPREKNIAIMRLYQLIQLDLALIWQPPVVEEDFISLVTNCCYKLLENPEAVKMKTTKEGIFLIIGIFIKRYKHATNGTFKIVALLRHYEHLPLVLAEAVVYFHTEHEANDIVREIIREISQLEVEELSRDNAGTKSISTFIVELAQRIPSAVLSNIVYIINYLDTEVVSLRIGVLSVFREVIIRVLSKDNLTDKEKATRDRLLDRLEDHIHDVNAFVRSKALVIWCHLCNQQGIPLCRLDQLVTLVVGRLYDKSSLVRRSAMQLLQAFLICNPFSFKLSIEELKATLEGEEEKLQIMIPEEVPALECVTVTTPRPTGDELCNNATEDDVDSQGNEDDLNQSSLQELLWAREELSSHEQEQSEQNDEPDELAKQRVLVLYLKESLSFATKFETAIPLIKQMIGSKVTTDVLEAIDFFVVLFEFKVAANALDGVRRMLALVWSDEAVEKAAVVNAYKRLYLHSDGDKRKTKTHSLHLVNNLTDLINNSTHGELTCLEVIICEFMKSGEMDNSVIQILWERFTMKSISTTSDESRAALILISMLAGANVDIVRSNVDVLVRVGFGDKGREQLILVQYTCNTLLKLVTQDKTIAPCRFFMNHDVITNLVDILTNSISHLDKGLWISMMNSAIRTIYQLSEHPDKVCADIISQIAKNVCRDHTALSVDNVVVEGSLSTSSDVVCPTVIIKRYLSLVGQVALCQVIHMEVNIVKEIKRRQQLLEDDKKEKKRPRSSTVVSRKGSVTDDDDDMGIGCGNAEDMEAEYIREISEKEIINGDNLLSKLKPIILTICSQFHVNHDSPLRAAASLTLVKFMLVSCDFCKTNLRLLFTILERDPEPDIRANLIIAVGDLMVRFPNQLAPWTPNLYARLRDDSSFVRQNTVTILTHLILNDMIKVKGQISEMASCIVDENEKIANMTKVFFFELSKKTNCVYNILPDIISRLSDPEAGVHVENFRIILKYLLNFILKDKQAESLVEKLCHRFRTSKTDRQNHDLIYCISLLSNSVKCLQKIQDNFACYSDKLTDDVIHSTMLSIMNKVKKHLKHEQKVQLEEFESRVQLAHTKGVEADEIAVNLPEIPKTKRRRQQPGLNRTTQREDPTPSTNQRRRRIRSTATTKCSDPPKYTLNSSTDEDSSQFKTPARTLRTRKNTKRVQIDSSSSDEDTPFSDEDKEIGNTDSSEPCDTVTPLNKKIVSRSRRLHTPTNRIE